LNPKGKYGVLLLSSILVTYAIVGGMLHRVSAQDGSYRELALFNEVLDKVRNDYVDKPSSELALNGAIRGLLGQPFGIKINVELFVIRIFFRK